MRLLRLLPLLLVGCGSEKSQKAIPEPSGPPIIQQSERSPAMPRPATPSWEVKIASGTTSLNLSSVEGAPLMTISCRTGHLGVQVPSFTPIGSEERLSLGLGQEPVTLVADLRAKQPGVGAGGGVPENLEDLLERADRISAVYGSQQSGPYPAPAAAMKQQLAEACEPK